MSQTFQRVKEYNCYSINQADKWGGASESMRTERYPQELIVTVDDSEI